MMQNIIYQALDLSQWYVTYVPQMWPHISPTQTALHPNPFEKHLYQSDEMYN